MKKIKLLIASLAAISFCSCSDFLDSTPKGTMTEDKFFLSPDAGYSTVVKCYDMLGDAIGYEIPRMMLYNIATDDSEKGGSDASDRPSYGAQNETYIEGWEKKTSNLLIYKRLCKI